MATSSMTASEAHTMALLSRSDRWARGYRQSDGLKFVLFSGSAGQTYMASEAGCTCRSYQFRGRCAHQSAIRIEAERARAKASRRKIRYEDIFDLDEAF